VNKQLLLMRLKKIRKRNSKRKAKLRAQLINSSLSLRKKDQRWFTKPNHHQKRIKKIMKKIPWQMNLMMKKRPFVVRIVKMKILNCSDKQPPSSRENKRRDSNATKRRLIG
jgi:hypothetical protein